MLMRRLATRTAQSGARTFFGHGKAENAVLDVTYRSVIKTPEVKAQIADYYAHFLDSYLYELGAHQAGRKLMIGLNPKFGDPHQVLKAYSLTKNPVPKEDHLHTLPHVTMIQNKHEELYKYGTIFQDADGTKVWFEGPDLDLINFLAQKLLARLELPQTPEAAENYLNSLFEGVDLKAYEDWDPFWINRNITGLDINDELNLDYDPLKDHPWL